jgi:hypothetical protein
MNTTKKQRDKAAEILGVFWGQELPDFLTPREATRLCEKWYITDDRFRRISQAKQDSQPIPLAAIALEIAKKAGQ